MPDYPSFQPAGAPGNVANAAISGLEAGQSYMDRASRLRMDEETQRVRMAQEEVLRPVRQAQATAEIAAANNQLSAMKQTEEMRGIAHGEMPGLRDEWSRASQIDEPGERVRAMSNVLGRASKYESVGELKPEIDVWKNVLASQAITERTLDSVNQRLNAASEMDKAKAQHAQELATLKGENDRLKQEAVNKGKVEAAKISASKGYEHLVTSYQAAVDAGDEETAQMLDAQIKKRNHIAQPYSDAERIKALSEEATAAESEGNAALAKSLRDRITYLTKRGGAGDREAKLRAILGPSSAAPAQSAPAASNPSGVTVPPKIKF